MGKVSQDRGKHRQSSDTPHLHILMLMQNFWEPNLSNTALEVPNVRSQCTVAEHGSIGSRRYKMRGSTGTEAPRPCCSSSYTCSFGPE